MGPKEAKFWQLQNKEFLKRKFIKVKVDDGSIERPKELVHMLKDQDEEPSRDEREMLLYTLDGFTLIAKKRPQNKKINRIRNKLFY